MTTPYEGTATRPLTPGDPVEAPLRQHSATVRPEWVDYNDHMTESAYLLVFGDAADALFRMLGIDEAYRAAGHSLYTVETHLHHRRELSVGDPLTVTIQLLDVDDKRVHLYQEMHDGASGDLVASAEQLLVHVDMAAGRSAPIPPAVADRLAAILEAHRALPAPPTVGRPMGIRRSPASPATPSPTPVPTSSEATTSDTPAGDR
ncbi:putative 3-hydroxyacyl-CoA dehydrogenase protein [Nostocoides japonicum T1-X7]|uniref:Putative 3-hydroxyacyl-CoA dehydrogenase protein n=1 Tax=Nostocoides japonicum T1-X7 TaxID=1194083 RepID=A0A077M010_9MICO|nr:thioesterase family protein [Tetrasphaera japonica]CCH77565.1 putative 3-hydroxyacyl-CoA dehydrogenase protein [Tetrasphaera japonica T1-X7]